MLITSDTDPVRWKSVYHIAGPALISFSGGRTSGFMLHEIVKAYDGALPDDVVVTFANTGKEREETLRFVHECSSRWGVKVRWLQWVDTPDTFEEVGYNLAARNGEPFANLIRKKKFVPDGFTRFCTQFLKVKVMEAFMRSLGYDHWTNVIGLRYDEGHRVLKQLERNDEGKEVYKTVMPLSSAHVTKRDVMAFWAEQPFDLKLFSHEGNCDLCFLKGRRILQALIKANPGMEDWWIEQESSRKGTFRKGERYKEIANYAHNQLDFFYDFLPEEEYEVECGLTCPIDDGELVAA